ncbi:MAG: efflux RND transporter periplasmic adaptor subunit [Treponema sp.]|nr:efflux RND transporter periplasmic adaptor subunit [Treponema sp.]
MENKEAEKKETEKKADGKKSKINPKTKKVIGIAVVIVVIAGLCVAGYFFWTTITWLTTQNAKVTATTINIIPMTAGRLTRWTVNEGDMVTENEVIGRVENTSYLRSPINGQVVKSNAVINQLVSQASVIGVIADTSDMYILANIEETKIMKVHEGQKVNVVLDAFPRRTFEGIVAEINMLTQDALGGSMSLTTSGTYVKITKLIPVKIRLTGDVDLAQILGTNATISIRLR